MKALLCILFLSGAIVNFVSGGLMAVSSWSIGLILGLLLLGLFLFVINIL
jgi:hypothetical protein